MNVQLLQVSATDLTAAPYHTELFEPGRPTLSADAAAWDSAGGHPMGYVGERHEPPEWRLVVIVTGTDAADLGDNVAQLVALVVPGAKLAVQPRGAAGTRDTYLLTVSDPAITTSGPWARVEFTGTRTPYWHGAQVDTSEAAVSGTGGTMDVVCAGDVPALTRYYLHGPGGGVALGVWLADAGFTPKATSGATTTMTNADTWYTAASRTITTAAYNGSYLVVARVTAPAGATTKLRVRTTTGAVVEDSEYALAADPGNAEAVCIGPVQLPATGWVRDYPSTTVALQAACDQAGEDVTVEEWWLLPAPCPQHAGACAVHAGDSMVLDGLPEYEPNVYGWDYANSTVLGSELADATLLGWPMLRPGTTTVGVVFGTGTGGHLRVSHVPRYLLPA